jgi:putative ABC transport system permease protein
VTWLETLRTGWAAVRSHALRSTLTVLGILIGIAAVILTVGLGLGTQHDVSKQISSLGSNLLIVRPGSSTSISGIRGGFGSRTTLTQADAQALTSRTNAPDVKAVAAEKSTSQELDAGSTNWTTTVVGTTPSWLEVRGRTLQQGRFITAADNTNRMNVIVLGPETATELFGTTFVTGQTVSINGTDFQVIGVLAPQGSSGNANLDDTGIVPMSTAANQLVGGSDRNSVNTIYIEAASGSRLAAANQEATNLLLNLHGIASSASADFTISSQDALVSTATSVAKTLTILLTGIAALSLLVGGIGVMNIMLVSVTERTREIGLRKALGAPPWAIRRQFLVEASVLGLTGGVLGAAIGVIAAKTLPNALGSTVVVSGAAVAGSVVIAVGIGLIFGVYPATRAARLAPIDALRAE